MSEHEEHKAPELILPNENTFIDWAVEEFRKNEGESSFIQPTDRTLLIVGSRGVGKSTFIVRTFDLDEEIKPTLGLEYYFALNSDLDAKNELCNIWELGGGTIFSSTLYSIEKMPNLTAVLILDLAAPFTLSQSFKSLLDILFSFMSKREDLEEMKKTAKELVKDHEDADVLEPFPVPLVIVCTKFDKFQSFEPEQRRVICKYLRFLAHQHHATLYFFSSKAPTLVRTSKEIMRHFTHGFDPMNTINTFVCACAYMSVNANSGYCVDLEDIFRDHIDGYGNIHLSKVQTDYNKPLLVPAGSDKFASIDEGLEDTSTMESYDKLLNNYFKQEPPKEKKFDITPILAAAKERRIDDLLQLKEEELVVQKVEEDLKSHLSRAQHLATGEGKFLYDTHF